MGRECKPCVTNIQLPSAHQQIIYRDIYLQKYINWHQSIQVEMFLLLQISWMLLSNLSSDFQITVHLLSSSATVLWAVYAFDLYNLYCFCIVYSVLYAGCYRVLRLRALPHSSADVVVTAIKRLQKYFRLVLELKRLTTWQGVFELNTKRFHIPYNQNKIKNLLKSWIFWTLSHLNCVVLDWSWKRPKS